MSIKQSDIRGALRAARVFARAAHVARMKALKSGHLAEANVQLRRFREATAAEQALLSFKLAA